MIPSPSADNQDSPDTGLAAENDEPEYTFDGYQVEFSQKIMLTPADPKKSA